MSDRFYDDPEMAVHYEQFRPNYFGVGLEGEVTSFIERPENASNVKHKETLALDIGCGSGQLTRVLAPLFTKVVGMDCSDAQIKRAREVTKEENIEYMTGIAEDLSFFKDDSVDFISTAMAMHYFTPVLFLAEVRRVLRPGGSVLLMMPTTESFTFRALTDNEKVNDKVMEIMREVVNVTLDRMSKNAIKVVSDGNYSVPDFPDKHEFQLTVQRPYDGIEEVIGFLKTAGGLREQMKRAPEKGDPYELFKKSFGDKFPNPRADSIRSHPAVYLRTLQKASVKGQIPPAMINRQRKWHAYDVTDHKETLALDIGCGSGQLTRVLAPLFTKVVGMDCSEAQIKVAREVTKEENIEYMTGIAEDLSFFKDNSVDFISTAMAMHYFTPDLFLAEVRRVLRPGGSVLFMTSKKKDLTLTALTDNDKVNGKVMEIAREMTNVALGGMSKNAGQVLSDGNYSVPDFPDNHQFQLTANRRYDGIHGAIGFLKSLGGLREYMKRAPEKGDPYEQIKERFLSVLAESSPTPEQTPFVLTLLVTCCLYMKPL